MIEYKEMRIALTQEGMTVPVEASGEGNGRGLAEQAPSAAVTCAVSWNDLDSFLDLLLERLLGSSDTRPGYLSR